MCRAMLQVQYCSNQAVPNCRGWDTYTITPPQSAQPIKLQEAFGLWWDATIAGQPQASNQLVDSYDFPHNPSCVYPPG